MGDRVVFVEDNVHVRVEVVEVEDEKSEEITTRTFTLRALEKSDPHAIAGYPINLNEEFTVSVNVAYIDHPFGGVAWYFMTD